MRIPVIGLLFLFLVAASEGEAQTPDAAALKPSFDALTRALSEKDMTALRAELLAMLQDDQRHRGALTDALKTGADLQTPALKQIEIEQEELDRAALVKLQRILDSRGWPSAALVGRDAQQAAFLVLQHAPAEVQEKYLPMAREAHRTGELAGSSLALLEDRVLMRSGKKQLYGTQLHTKHGSRSLQVWPIDDEANVDARRKAMGLEPLADYLRRFNIR